jgi:hypothetical protein
LLGQEEQTLDLGVQNPPTPPTTPYAEYGQASLVINSMHRKLGKPTTVIPRTDGFAAATKLTNGERQLLN